MFQIGWYEIFWSVHLYESQPHCTFFFVFLLFYFAYVHPFLKSYLFAVVAMFDCCCSPLICFSCVWFKKKKKILFNISFFFHSSKSSFFFVHFLFNVITFCAYFIYNIFISYRIVLYLSYYTTIVYNLYIFYFYFFCVALSWIFLFSFCFSSFCRRRLLHYDYLHYFLFYFS